MATKAFKSEKIDAIKAKVEKAQVAVITEYKGNVNYFDYVYYILTYYLLFVLY